MPTRLAFIAMLALCAPTFAATRTIEFDTNEVTQPSISATPGGRTIVFDLLGHLFEISVGGGAAKQLTFGPYYDSGPAVSPDGKRVAFISNRDGGDDGNVYVLDLASGKIAQLTHEFQTGSPTWSQDGKTIAFLSGLRREEYPADRLPGFGGGDLAYVETVATTGGPIQRLTDAKAFGSVFYFADGRLGWTIADRQPGPGR